MTPAHSVLLAALRIVILFVFPFFLGGAAGQANKLADVQGSVTDSISNQPIHRAMVTLTKNQETTLGAYTDSTGNFNFHAIEPGAYVVSVEHDGFVLTTKEKRSTITAVAGVRNDAGTFKMDRTGAISGHVTNQNAEGVAGAAIQLQALRMRKTRQETTAYGVSDDRGNFRVFGIPPGKYKLHVTCDAKHGSAVKMQVEKEKNASADPYAMTYYPGTLDASQAAPIQVDAGSDLQGLDIVLLRTRGVRVRGHLAGPDGAQPGVLGFVVLTSLSGSGSSFDSQVSRDGAFEMNQVTPGKYILNGIAVTEPGKQLVASQLLEIGDADIGGLQLTLNPGQAITGSVTPPADRKLPRDLVVVVQDRLRRLSSTMVSERVFARVQANGAFASSDVTPGEYDVVLANGGKGDDLYVKAIRAGDQDVLASGLHIGSVPSAPIEIVLGAKGAQIDFDVLDAGRKPVPEALITLLPDPPRTLQMALRGECRTDASGRCTLSGMAPGDYHAYAASPDDPIDFTDPDSAASVEKSGKALSVAEGDKKSMQLDVLPSEN